MKIGFIGLGNMGGPMCCNIIKYGKLEVSVFDLNSDAVQACVDVGGKASSSVAELAANSDVIMTSLPMPKDVEAVALGAGGIAENARPGSIHVDLSTNSPLVVHKIAAALEEKGIIMMDAPVSGGAIGAEQRSIAIMVGGDKSAYEQCMPIFESFCTKISLLGGVGNGCIAKIVNNLMAFCNMAAAAEGLMLGAAAGIDPEALDEVIRASSGDSMCYRVLADKTLSGDWSPGFTVDLAYKDMHLALELADELAIPLQLSPQVHNLMRMAKGMGFAGDDMTAVMRVYEGILGREVRKTTDPIT